jgi:hypothetical protein
LDRGEAAVKIPAGGRRLAPLKHAAGERDHEQYEDDDDEDPNDGHG